MWSDPNADTEIGLMGLTDHVRCSSSPNTVPSHGQISLRPEYLLHSQPEPSNTELMAKISNNVLSLLIMSYQFPDRTGPQQVYQ